MDSTHFDEAVERLRVKGRSAIVTEEEARVLAAAFLVMQRELPTDAELAEFLAGLDDDNKRSKVKSLAEKFEVDVGYDPVYPSAFIVELPLARPSLQVCQITIAASPSEV